MKRFSQTLISCLALSVVAVSAMAADPYKVRAQFSDDENGAMVYLINFDTNDKLDSVVVQEKEAVFKGEIDEPVLARLLIDGSRTAPFILESGSIIVEPFERKAFGSMLNDQLAEFKRNEDALAKQYQQCDNDSARREVYSCYIDLAKSTMTDNIDNPIGLYLFVELSQSMDQAESDALIKLHPSLENTNFVKKLRKVQQRKAATSVGKKFADFEVTYNGKTQRLSDYVGHGKYVIVDYWASWCGPCIRQIPVLKELLAELGDKGLEVLGVAVWDEPANTLEAIKSHGITWPCIIDAQTIPTDLYGINGIPCIILYGPDGTILSRDKQGDELKSDVRAAFEGMLKVD